MTSDLGPPSAPIGTEEQIPPRGTDSATDSVTQSQVTAPSHRPVQSNGYGRSDRRPTGGEGQSDLKSHGKRVRVFPAVLAGLAAALIAAALGPPPFESRTRFRYDPAVAANQIESIRRELIGFLGQNTAGSGSTAWEVQSSPPELTFTIAGFDPSGCLRRANELADTFLDQIREQSRQAREAPTDAERIVQSRRASLQTDARELERMLSVDNVTIDQTPAARQEQRLGRWQQLRRVYESKRQALDLALAALSRLETDGRPLVGDVAADERDRERRADLALQQDLKELHVNLGELRAELNTVVQNVDDRVSAASDVAAAMVFDLGQLDLTEHGAEVRASIESLARLAQDYRLRLSQFADAWGPAAERIRRPIDAANSKDTIDAHDRLQDAARTLRYSSTAEMESIERKIADLAADRTVAAKAFELTDAVSRAFRSLHQAHRQLAFQLGRVDPLENFRLDAAWRSARGLLSRTQARIQAIDDALAAQGLARAEREYSAALDSARTQVDGLRVQTDAAVADIVQSQTALVDSMTESARQTAAAARADVHGRLEAARAELDLVERQLQALAQARMSAAHHEPLILESISSELLPADALIRLTRGGIAGLITLLGMILIQVRPRRPST